MTSRDELIAQIAERLREVAQVMRDSTTQEWLQLDLSMAQLKALFVLAAAAPVTIGALAQALGIQLPAASHIADRLVQLGLAERYEDPADRRRTFVRLTAQASVLVERLRQGKREWLLSRLAALGDDDLAALLQGLRAFAAVVVERDGLRAALPARTKDGALLPRWSWPPATDE